MQLRTLRTRIQLPSELHRTCMAFPPRSGQWQVNAAATGAGGWQSWQPYSQQTAVPPTQRSISDPIHDSTRPQCRFGPTCFRADCWFYHPERVARPGVDAPPNSRNTSQASPVAAAAAAAAATPAVAVPAECDPAAPWRTQSRAATWKVYPREDSYGCLVVAHENAAVTLDRAALASTPLSQLRFLLVQRASTSQFHNLINELQEAPGGEEFKQDWWVKREAERCTDSELDLLAGDFEAMWNDETRVSAHWKLDFADANKDVAMDKHPRLQRIIDSIRAARAFSGRSDPSDDQNVQQLNFVIPKGQFQTRASLSRLPHLPAETQQEDASVHAGAIREVVEETHMPASNFKLLTDLEPLHFAQYPPRKVDVFLATLTPGSEFHPSLKASWIPGRNPETRLAKWFSMQQIIAYFAEARIWHTTYTATCVHQIIQRFQWEKQLEGYVAPKPTPPKWQAQR
jgi:hypothetical protein